MGAGAGQFWVALSGFRSRRLASGMYGAGAFLVLFWGFAGQDSELLMLLMPASCGAMAYVR